MIPVHTMRGQHSGLARGQTGAQSNSFELDHPPGREKQPLVGSKIGVQLLDRQRQVRLCIGASSGQHAHAHGDMEVDN